MEQTDSYDNFAALAWQVELGADEAISETPVDRFSLDSKQPIATPEVSAETRIVPAATPSNAIDQSADAIREAKQTAKSVTSLAELEEALANFTHCDLKKGARNTVFSDGHPAARIMVIGEAPGRDEDREGKPFVGRAGQLLDKMFVAIGRQRNSKEPDSGLYITNIMPWRPPQNRDPEPQEIAMLMPFVERHVELVNPEVLVCMGNISCQGILGRRGITRLRGNWLEAFGKPVMPMFHPAYLLRNPSAKRHAWEDLLEIQAKLRGVSK